MLMNVAAGDFSIQADISDEYDNKVMINSVRVRMP
jgi:hypothetical protein